MTPIELNLLDNNAFYTKTITLPNQEKYIITMCYSQLADCWTMDLEYNGNKICGVPIIATCEGTNGLFGVFKNKYNLPYAIYVETNFDLKPTGINAFTTGGGRIIIADYDRE